jgi:hypothetical protein
MLHMGRRERNSYLESQDVFCVLAAFEIFTGHTELPGNDFSYSEWQCECGIPTFKKQLASMVDHSRKKKVTEEARQLWHELPGE